MKNLISKEFLNILACPICKSSLIYNDKNNLICTKCKEVYLIKDGIPILLPSC